MKIKFDFGTQKAIPYQLISLALAEVVKSCEEQHGLKVGKSTIYLTMYDGDGMEQLILNDEFKELNYLIRAKPYKKLPKDTKLVGKWSANPEAYMYVQYT